VSLASLNQLCHQRVTISLPHLHKEIRGAIERDITVFGTITSGMTTGVGDVGDLVLRHARYLQSLLAQLVEPIMVAPLAACLSEGVSGGLGNVHQGRKYTWRREH